MHAGYKSCLELLQPDSFHQLPGAVHASKLQAACSQDSSARVRRAGFYAWLALQEHLQGSDDCSDWDKTALQFVQGRCADRFASSRMHFVLQPLDGLVDRYPK